LVDKAVKFTQDQYGKSVDVVRLEGVYCFSLQDSVMEICSQIIDDDESVLNEGLGLGQDDPTPFDGNL